MNEYRKRAVIIKKSQKKTKAGAAKKDNSSRKLRKSSDLKELSKSPKELVISSGEGVDSASEIQNVKSVNLGGYGQDLLEDARSLWLTGDWDTLSAWHVTEYSNNPKRLRIALLIASALHEVSDYDGERDLLRTMLDWGANRRDLLNVMIGQAHASMGRARLLTKEFDLAEKHFLACIKCISPNVSAKRYAQDRVFKEAVALGLIPDALGIIQTEVQNLSDNPKNNGHIAVIETKVELLKHELSIAMQRGQIGTSKKSETVLVGTAIDSATFKENLKNRATSQLGQELWVLERMDYKRGGFFVEFGATDGVMLSNTYMLEKEFGWTGLCAEPNPQYYEKLVRNRSCIVSQDCISGHTGEKVEFLLAEEYGGIVDHLDNHNKARRKGFQDLGKYIQLSTISLNDYLKKNNALTTIDYLSIDTEGSEYEILRNFSFNHFKVNLITVEHNYSSTREKLRELLEGKGYKRTERDFDDWYELINS